MNILARKNLVSFIALMFAALLTTPVLAAKPVPASSLTTDLQGLVSEGNALNTQLSGINLTADNLCSELLQANQAANVYIDNIAAIDAGLAAPLSLDADALTALDDLSAVTLNLANEAMRLSINIDSLSATTQMFTISDGLVAMLQLSDDIGVMADRILEMADKILVMADNIGLMADRIIATQEIQNANIALTQASILTTQQNILTLVSVIDTSVFDIDLQNLVSDGNLLAWRMATVLLSPSNMATELQSIATDISTYANNVVASDETISTAAASNTLTINQDSLTSLANISIIMTSLGTALEGYALAVDGLSAITTEPTLADATGSMLSLSNDIGIMANRILEMGDLILAMSDNIGLQADQILLTQQLQSTNVAATQAAILSAQATSIALVASLGL